MRKAIDMVKMVQEANDLLARPDSEYATPEIRKGIAYLLERCLHETDRYAGYNFQASEFIPVADRVPDGPVLKPDYDHTRRAYYVKGYKH